MFINLNSIFKIYFDSFSPSGNVFGTVEKMRKIMNKPMSKEMEKNIDKMQKTLDVHQENITCPWTFGYQHTQTIWNP